jgi:hypothetical protein
MASQVQAQRAMVQKPPNLGIEQFLLIRIKHCAQFDHMVDQYHLHFPAHFLAAPQADIDGWPIGLRFDQKVGESGSLSSQGLMGVCQGGEQPIVASLELGCLLGRQVERLDDVASSESRTVVDVPQPPVHGSHPEGQPDTCVESQ